MFNQRSLARTWSHARSGALLLFVLSAAAACNPATTAQSGTVGAAGVTGSGGIPDSSPEDGAVELVLENKSGKTIYVQTSNALGWEEWVSVANDRGETLDIQGDCSFCVCGGACWVCGMALPAVEAVESGDDVRYLWNRRVWTYEGQGLEQCRRETPVPEGPKLATFCWGEDVVDARLGQRIDGQTCDALPFELDSEELRYTITR